MPTIVLTKSLPWVKKYKPFEGMAKPPDGFKYTSRTWRATSKAYLKEHPLCVMCKKKGKIVQATCTDHIVPIRLGIDPYDVTNFQGLCRSCHAWKSNSDRGDQYGVGISIDASDWL